MYAEDVYSTKQDRNLEDVIERLERRVATLEKIVVRRVLDVDA